jgi:hypothetical protein
VYSSYPSMARPKGLKTKHLKEAERARVRTLYFDGKFGPARIAEITGYTRAQIRNAIRADSAAVGVRTGRPKVQSKTSAGESGESVAQTSSKTTSDSASADRTSFSPTAS